MPRASRLRWLPLSPLAWLRSRWRHRWRWAIDRTLFEHRHVRRLAPLALLLGGLTLLWSSLVIALGLALGGAALIWHPGFAQSVLASLLVLPLSLAVAVFIGTLLHKHTLRFQVRHAGDRLADGVRLAAFKFILFLQRDCALPVDIAGPVDEGLVRRARETAHRSFVDSSWTAALPPDFDLRLDETVDALAACFQAAPDLRVAFPRAFDLMEALRTSHAGIRAGSSQSDPRNTALIVLHYAAGMIRDLR